MELVVEKNCSKMDLHCFEKRVHSGGVYAFCIYKLTGSC